MSDTPRTEAVNQYLRTRRDYTKTDHEVWMNHGIQIERELNAANDRIKSLIEERDRANRLAEWKWNLRDEFELLLGTNKIEEGIEAVKELKRHIQRLEEESESRWMLAQSATGSCAEMSSRIKRLEEAGDFMAYNDQLDFEELVKRWIKAKEAKL